MNKDDEMASTESYSYYIEMERYCKENDIDMSELIDRVVRAIPVLKYNDQLTKEENAYDYWNTYKEVL